MRISKLLFHVCAIMIAASFFAWGVNETAAAANADVPERPARLADILGSTHTGGWYYFTEKDYLNEGADELLSMGMRTIKIWFNTNPANNFPYKSNWPADLKTMTEVAQTPYYQELFNKPFHHYILEAGEGSKVNWKNGMAEDEVALVENEFYEVAKYFLTTYQGTGKTFVLQNWEGDAALEVKKIPANQVEAALNGMADWLNARQDGITRARNEIGMNGVKVVGAAEVNLAPSKYEIYTQPLVIDRVVPYTHMDLYSLSSWGTGLPSNVTSLIEKLDYLKAKAPDSELYGSSNIMLGEFGAYENIYKLTGNTYPALEGNSGDSQLYFNKKQLEQALDWGVVYALYWQLYCNGLAENVTLQRPQTATSNDQLRGVWMIRPDGSKTPTYDYFKHLLEEDPLVYHNGIQLTIDGESIYFEQPPVPIDGYPAVPMKKIFELLGAEMEWNAPANTATARKGSTVISLAIGEPIATVNGQTVPLDVPAALVNGTVMVPLGFVGEALQAEVEWDSQAQWIRIVTNGASTLPPDYAEQEQQAGAARDQVDDHMTDYSVSKVLDRSGNWAVKSEINPSEGLISRVHRTTNDSAYLMYRISSDIVSWSLTAFHEGANVGPMFKVYLSKDGEVWTEAPIDTARFNTRSAGRAGFLYSDIFPLAAPEAGNQYIKFEAVSMASGSWVNQISKIKVVSSEAMTATLTGNDQVETGAAYILSYGLNGAGNVSAQDVTFSYDSEIFEFLEATPLAANTVIADTYHDQPGLIRFKLANTGTENTWNGNLHVLRLSLQTKAASAGSILAMSNIVLADGQGNEFGGAPVQKNVIVAAVIDRSALQAAIQAAQELYDASEEGAHDGQYILGAKSALQAALTKAQGVLGDAAASQSQLHLAGVELNQAVTLFQSKQITPGMGEVTGDGRISIADLGFVAFHFGSTNTSGDWAAAQRADMNGNGVIDLYDLTFVAKRIP